MRSYLSNLMIQDKEIADLTGVKIRVFQPENMIKKVTIDSQSLIKFIEEIPEEIKCQMTTYKIPLVVMLFPIIVWIFVGIVVFLWIPFIGLPGTWINCYCKYNFTFTFLIPKILLSCNFTTKLLMFIVSIMYFLFIGMYLYSINKDHFAQIHFKLTRERHLKGILKEIKQYNELIKAIDINDQLEYANNRQTNITDREKIIEALKLTRLDLIRALNIEKILWENKGFIQKNPTMFVNSLEALESLKMRDKASEYGQFSMGLWMLLSIPKK